MDTLVPPPGDVELHLLTEWGTLTDSSGRRRAGVLSLLAHGVLIGTLLAVPVGVEDRPRETAELPQVTPLVAPPLELTQRTPNTRKITKEFESTEVQPRPRVQVPSGAPSTNRPRAPRFSDLPPTPPVATQPAPLPEPPKVDATAPNTDLPQLAQLSPQIQPVENPKLELQNVGPAAPPQPAGRGRVPIPNPSVSEAIRQAIHGGGGGQIVGDLDLGGPGGVGEAMNLPPAPGVQGSQLELLSDPKGVDFRPYLTQVLAAVRRNWLAVIPESAKMGRQGRVGIEFYISRSGGVPKLVIVLHSGTDALDRAAVAGISASNPFPPLPAEYKGDRIALRFSFAYNMPRRR